jgi:O-Antigen ligase
MSRYLDLGRFVSGPRSDALTRPVLAALVGLAGAVLIAILASAGSPVVALVGVVGLACGAIMVVSPTFALCVLCFSLPFERIGRLTNDSDAVTVSASRILGLAALGIYLVHALLRREKLRFGWPFWLYGGFAAIGLLSNAWTNSADETFRDSFRILGNLLFFFYLFNAIRDYKTARLVVIVWMLASVAAGGYSLADYYLNKSQPIGETEVGLTNLRTAGTVVSDAAEIRALGVNVRRLFGTTSHPALFGINNLMVIPFFFWGIRAQKGFWRLLWLGGLLVTIYCVLLSNTRAIFLLGIFTVAYALIRRLIPLTPQLVFVSIALAAAVIPFIPQDVYKRTLDVSLYTTEKGDAIRARFKLLNKSLELVESHFWTGIGVGDQTTLVKMMTDESTGYVSTEGLRASAHNEYVWILVEVGVFGYFLHYAFVWVVTRSSFKAAQRTRSLPDAGEQYFFLIACQCVMLVILLSAVQSTTFHYPLKGWWLLTAISYMLWTHPEALQSVDGQVGPVDPVV